MDIKKNKTLLFITTAALIITVLFAGSAAAAEGFKISAARVEGGTGGQVTVSIAAEKAKGSEGGQFTLTFDQSLVRPVYFEPGDLVLSVDNNLYMANLDYAPGELIFMWVTTNADTKDSGVVCKVTFDLLKEGTTAIAFRDLIIVDETGGSANAVAGRIKIGPAAPGEGSVTGPGQEAESTEEYPGAGDYDAGEEVIGEDGEEGETDIVAERTGLNPILVAVPIIIIIALGVVYYLMKKSGNKKQKK